MLHGYRISVVVPVYNVEKYLRTCIESLINQTKAFYEIILVNDGSRDSSPLICDEYQDKYLSVNVIHKANGGLSSARNEGIRKASGDYILFVDSDDTIENNTCELFTNIIKNRDENVDLIVGNLRKVMGIKTIEKHHSYEDMSKLISGKEYLEYEYERHTMHMASVQCLYSKKFLLENQLWFTKGILHEDELFTPVVFYKAQNVLATDIVFYNHMIREGSITTQKNKIGNAKSIIKICIELQKMYGNKNVRLHRLIMEHCVDLYYKVYVDANLIDFPDIRIEKKFLKKYSLSLKNKFRTFLYLMNENILYIFERKRRKIYQ